MQIYSDGVREKYSSIVRGMAAICCIAKWPILQLIKEAIDRMRHDFRLVVLQHMPRVFHHQDGDIPDVCNPAIYLCPRNFWRPHPGQQLALPRFYP
jgi:hypothetical protein